MEAKLKDGSILYVDAEERIYAQGISGGPFPLVIDQVEGEKLLIEFAEQQQQEIKALTNLKKTLEEANHGMQRKIEEQQQEIERYKRALIHFAHSNFKGESYEKMAREYASEALRN